MADDLSELRRFLGTLTYRERLAGLPRRLEQNHPFITISRQAGAGGHALAQALLERFAHEPDRARLIGAPRDPNDWHVVDQEVCRRLIEEHALKVPMRSLMLEEYRSTIEDLVFSVLGGDSPQAAIVKRMFETVRAFAEQGRVILVGRAGSCVTRDLPGGVHLRLVAPESVRIKRIAERLALSEREARAVVRRRDADRAQLVRAHFHRDIDDPLLYDAVWNTSEVPFEVIAEAAAAIVAHRAGAAQASSPPEGAILERFRP